MHIVQWINRSLLSHLGGRIEFKISSVCWTDEPAASAFCFGFDGGAGTTVPSAVKGELTFRAFACV